MPKFDGHSIRTVSMEGDVRIGPVISIPIVLSELGVDPLEAFAKANINPRLFDSAENRLSLEAFGHLFETCVSLTGCSHFGLLVGEHFEMHNFAMLGTLMRNSPSVGIAIRHLLLNLNLFDRGAAPVLLSQDPGRLLLGYSVYRHGAPAADQIHDVAIAVGYRILSEICGYDWRPLGVQFSHHSPSDIAPYRRIFKSGIRFNTEVSGLVLDESLFNAPIQGADLLQYQKANASIQQQALGALSFAEMVEAALPQMLLSGTATSASIARMFNIHERTLRRRLEDEGKNLQLLINKTRLELAKQLLHNTGLSISSIAGALHYNDPTAFSRAFRQWTSLSPKQWRDSTST